MGLLIIFGLFSLLGFNKIEHVIIGLLTVSLITLPDIDIRLEIAHRKYTHNVVAAIIFGLLSAMLYHPLGYIPSFLAGFSATLLHILGDLLTYMPFAPLWPFMKAKIALKLFSSSNRAVNEGFWALGLATFMGYMLFVYSGFGYNMLAYLRELYVLFLRLLRLVI